MGEVYKATDTRLDRTVAIKILPSADPELKVRFDREARAIAGLQHPHICTLHDVGHENGTDYLVLEYLEGETLADRLKRGPLKPEEAIATAIDVIVAGVTAVWRYARSPGRRQPVGDSKCCLLPAST